jgi:hypothetical protein
MDCPECGQPMRLRAKHWPEVSYWRCLDCVTTVDAPSGLEFEDADD